MKPSNPAVFDTNTQTVTIQLTDAEWEDMERIDFQGVWYFLRFTKKQDDQQL